MSKNRRTNTRSTNSDPIKIETPVNGKDAKTKDVKKVNKNVKDNSSDDLEGEAEADLFQTLADAAIDGIYSIEQIIELCYSYGVVHGDILAKKLASKSFIPPPPPPIPVLSISSEKQPSKKTKNGLLSCSVSLDGVTSIDSNGKDTSQETSSSHSMDAAVAHRLMNGYRQVPFEADYLPSSNSQVVKVSSPRPLTSFSIKKEEFKGVRIRKVTNSSSSSSSSHHPRYEAFLSLQGTSITLGDYENELEAAQEHDRATIRAVGPCHCSETDLNFNIRFYARDNIELFNKHDRLLKEHLFATNWWNGVKECDFSFLIIPFPSYHEIHRNRLKSTKIDGRKKQAKQLQQQQQEKLPVVQPKQEEPQQQSLEQTTVSET
jgi:hypothetical protein